MDIVDKANTVAEENLDRAILAARRVIAPSIDGSKPSATCCVDCDDPIPEARRTALPGVQLCVTCATAAERVRFVR